MSGQERLMIGAQLYMFAINIARAGIMNQTPGISKKDLKKELLEKIYKDESYGNFVDIYPAHWGDWEFHYNKTRLV